MQEYQIPELLSPAGNLEKLKVAILYGADAVYLGGQKFGLRAAADNFTLEELKEGVEFAHERGRKVYVVLNSFLHDDDLEGLAEFVTYLEALKIDALIVSDVGVIQYVKKHCSIPIHLSTQASCLNVEAAKFWKQAGVERIVVGRELTIKETALIKKEAQVEVEMFIHGSMCMAYSGNCVISNYTQGRDSNRGGCAHSCRFEYSLDFGNDQEKIKAYFMSSKDLEGVRALEDFIKASIDSLKVEGRMKSHLYAGTITKVYREALDFYKNHGHFYSPKILDWENELKKVSHRSYSSGSLIEKAGAQTIYNERENSHDQTYEMTGIILNANKQEVLLQVRNAFNIGDQLEILPFQGENFKFQVENIQTISGERISRTKPSTVVRLTGTFPRMQQLELVRRAIL